MAFYKKLNKFGRILWVAQLDECTDKEAIEISKKEYKSLTSVNEFDDVELRAE